jgi:hypothetical protein
MRRGVDALIQIKAPMIEVWRSGQSFTSIWIRPPSGKVIVARA